jgi:hypothetical protein
VRRLVVPIACLVLVAVAPQAAGQEARRDPFRPLVSEEGAVVSTAPSQPSGSTDTGTGTSDQPATSGGSPNTGMPASDWTAVAYMLIALGAAAIALARLRRPVAVAPRRRRL